MHREIGWYWVRINRDNWYIMIWNGFNWLDNFSNTYEDNELEEIDENNRITRENR